MRDDDNGRDAEVTRNKAKQDKLMMIEDEEAAADLNPTLFNER